MLVSCGVACAVVSFTAAIFASSSNRATRSFVAANCFLSLGTFFLLLASAVFRNLTFASSTVSRFLTFTTVSLVYASSLFTVGSFAVSQTNIPTINSEIGSICGILYFKNTVRTTVFKLLYQMFAFSIIWKRLSAASTSTSGMVNRSFEQVQQNLLCHGHPPSV